MKFKFLKIKDKIKILKKRKLKFLSEKEAQKNTFNVNYSKIIYEYSITFKTQRKQRI